MIRVYVAGPYTKPDPEENVRKAIETANWLLEHGFVPFVPHLTHFWHLQHPQSYEAWIDYDLKWLRLCHFMLRLSGESRGADIEEIEAKRIPIPVVYSIEELLEVLDRQERMKMECWT